MRARLPFLACLCTLPFLAATASAASAEACDWLTDLTRPSALDELLLGARATPERSLECLDAAGAEPAEPTARAAALDVRAAALEQLGRDREAMDAMREALALDAGTERIDWLRRDGAVAGRIEIGPGNGRIERAARALLVNGMEDEARPLIERALALGAEGWAEGAWARTGGGRLPGRGVVDSILHARPWLPVLPDLEVPPLHGDEGIRLRDARGSVVVLDFWASWCPPCVEELPHLAELYDLERERGLLVIAINAQEPLDVARAFAGSLGLTMPLGRYDEAIDRAFAVQSLPAVIVADRHGRVRARWEGYEKGLEARIISFSRGLLDDSSLPPGRELATVLHGGDALEVRWSRDLAASIEGLTALPPGAEGRIAVSTDRAVELLSEDGRVLRQVREAAGAGRLRARRDGTALLGFRRGGTRLTIVGLAGGEARTGEAPAPLLDATFGPEPDELLVATTSGLVRWRPGGESAPAVAATGETLVSAIEPLSGEGHLALVPAERKLLRLDAALAASESRAVAGDRFAILPGGPSTGEIGLAAAAVTSAAAGRFLDGAGEQIAVTLASGQLAIFDRGAAEVRYRARWPSATALAAADLDGDARDELIVASGRTLVVLGRGSEEPGRAVPEASAE